MTRESQKASERFWAERLRDAANLNVVIQADSPAGFPDVLLSVSGREVGLEVTELHFSTPPGTAGGSALRAEDALKWKVLREAHARYTRSGAAPIAVQLLFAPGPGLALSDADAKQLAEQLCEFLIAHVPGSTDHERHNLYESTSLAPPLSTVYLRRSYPGETPRWEVVGAHLARPLRTDDVLEPIAAKNSRLSGLRVAGRSYWLLLVANRSLASSAFIPIDASLLDLSSSQFERTFLLLYPDALYEHSRAAVGPPNSPLQQAVRIVSAPRRATVRGRTDERQPL
jgi:hypothetical protein